MCVFVSIMPKKGVDMTDKKYPLDITVACIIGLEGGFTLHKDYLSMTRFFPANLDLVHEWNLTLKKTLKEPEFEHCISTKYKMLLKLSPANVARIIDRLAVPYRSYYYAKRFLDAAEFVYEHTDPGAAVIDFGRGLSPWCHIIRKNSTQPIGIYTFDTDKTANRVFEVVSKKMGLPMPSINEEPDIIMFDRDIFVSLGTFAYLTKEDQIMKLAKAAGQYRYLFIEMDKPNAIQPDQKLVKKLGTQYHSGLSEMGIKGILGEEIPFTLQKFGADVKDAYLRGKLGLDKVTERILVR